MTTADSALIRRRRHSLSCERRESRAAERSQAGAPLSWTNERADTFFVCEASEEGSG
jgi:hypothetical protein